MLSILHYAAQPGRAGFLHKTLHMRSSSIEFGHFRATGREIKELKEDGVGCELLKGPHRNRHPLVKHSRSRLSCRCNSCQGQTRRAREEGRLPKPGCPTVASQETATRRIGQPSTHHWRWCGTGWPGAVASGASSKLVTWPCVRLNVSAWTFQGDGESRSLSCLRCDSSMTSAGLQSIPKGRRLQSPCRLARKWALAAVWCRQCSRRYIGADQRGSWILYLTGCTQRKSRRGWQSTLWHRIIEKMFFSLTCSLYFYLIIKSSFSDLKIN